MTDQPTLDFQPDREPPPFMSMCAVGAKLRRIADGALYTITGTTWLTVIALPDVPDGTYIDTSTMSLLGRYQVVPA